MPQTPSGLDASAVSETTQLAALGTGRDGLSRAVSAANDAGNLADALGVNLRWVAEALSSGACSDEVRKLMCETVEVCRQLTRLLGGAIGSCRNVARTIAPRVAPIQLSRLVEQVVDKISRLADATGVLLLSEGPRDLCVTIDPDLVNSALESLLIRAVSSSPPDGVVRIAFTRCGEHAVMGLISDGPGLSPLQLAQLHSASGVATAGDTALSFESEALRSISSRLFEQGGHIDVETRPDGGTTIFVVFPASDEILDEPAKSGTVFAQAKDSPRRHEYVPGQKRSEKMIVNSDRFGVIEVDGMDILTFPTGIIGFPHDREFVLVRKADSQVVGWLQSTKTPYLTLPVVSAHALGERFPDVPIEAYAEHAGLGCDSEELALLAVLSAPPGQPATVNLMAPIIVNAATRTGAQVLIEGTRFTTRELFIIPESATLDLERTATAMPNETQAATSAAE